MKVIATHFASSFGCPLSGGRPAAKADGLLQSCVAGAGPEFIETRRAISGRHQLTHFMAGTIVLVFLSKMWQITKYY